MALYKPKKYWTFKSILCSLFGHNKQIDERYEFGCYRIECTRCGALWGHNPRVCITVKWDLELEELHRKEQRLPIESGRVEK